MPALLLLTIPLPGLGAAGLLLILNTSRLMVSRGIPAQFAERMIAPLGLAPAMAGALAIQLSICAICLGYALASASFAIVGSTIWALSAIARGAARTHRGQTFRQTFRSLALSGLLTRIRSKAEALRTRPEEQRTFRHSAHNSPR